MKDLTIVGVIGLGNAGEPLSLKGWDNWGYDIKVVDGTIVVNHKNRPQSKHPQYNSKS